MVPMHHGFFLILLIDSVKRLTAAVVCQLESFFLFLSRSLSSLRSACPSWVSLSFSSTFHPLSCCLRSACMYLSPLTASATDTATLSLSSSLSLSLSLSCAQGEAGLHFCLTNHSRGDQRASEREPFVISPSRLLCFPVLSALCVPCDRIRRTNCP